MEMDIDKIDNILESLLFVSGDALKVSDICELLELQKSEVNAAVKRLQKRYGGHCGIKLITFDGKLQLASNPDYADIIARVLNPIMEKALSTPAMETLSIIAYRQPVTRLDIEHIRGVNSDYAIQALLKNNLVEIVGRKDAIGKPLLFGTTENFLKRFAIENIDDLPGRAELLEKIREIEETTEAPDEQTLYNYDHIGGEENADNPDFLQGEDVMMIEADDPMSEAAATDENAG